MRNLILLFLLFALGFSSCRVNYYTTNRNLTFDDSIPLNTKYQLFVRKLGYDMDKDKIRMCNDRYPDTTQVKLVEMDYLLFDPVSHEGILIPYIPSYYYEYDKKDKGGLYTKIYSDSTLYLHQIRTIQVLEPSDNQTFCLGDYKYDYSVEKNGDGNNEAILWRRAVNTTNHYLTGTIHLDEAIGSPMRFERRLDFSFQQFIPDTLALNLFQKNRSEKIRTQLREQPKKQYLFILRNRGLAFHLEGNTKVVFRRSSTNWFSKKRCR